VTKTGTIYLFALVVTLLTCCTTTQQSMTIEEYLHWVNDEDNGFVKKKYVNGMEIKVKYLSPHYLAYREFTKDALLTASDKDSLINLYKSSLNFVLTLGPDERKGKGQDIAYRDVSNYLEYKTRVKALNFDIEKSVMLNTDGTEFLPVLSAMENIYSLDTKKNIVLAFVPDVGNENQFYHSEKVGFVYEDQLFGLGVNNFVFNRAELDNNPNLIY